MIRIRVRRAHKYGAEQGVMVDGFHFDSRKEATRYGELRLLEQAGEIAGLVLQPKFSLDVLTPTGELVHVAWYIADFCYFALEPSGHVRSRVVEDVKGVRTALYRLKKKHVEAQYGIRIREL